MMSSTIQDRIVVCSELSLKNRVSHAIIEAGKTLDVAKAVAAIVLSTDGVIPADAEIVAYVAGL